jgi:hypothetical protein
MSEEYRANDPAQVETRNQKAKRIQEQQQTDLQTLLQQPEFRRFVWRLIHETAGLLRDPFSSNGSVQTYNIGMSAVARTLWAEIERVDPAVIPKMMLEYAESQRQ